MRKNATSISPTGGSAKPYRLQDTMRSDNTTKTANDKDVGDNPKKQQQQQQTEKDKQQAMESSSAAPDDASSKGDNDGATTTPEKKDSAEDQDTAATTTTSPVASEINSNNNSTAAAPVRQRPALFRAQQHHPQQQPSGGRIIVLGAGGPSQQRQSMMPSQQQQQRGGDGRDEMLVEVLGGLAVRMVRLGILTWLSRHLMHREETIVPSQQFVWEVVNEKHDRDVQALKSTLRRPPHGLRASTWRALKARFQGKPPSYNNNNYYNSKNLTLANLYRRTVIVIEMSTYAKASDSANMPLEQLPDIVSFLTAQQTSHAFGTDKTTAEPLELEVILCLASPGGSATLYGKAAAELVRFKQSCPNLSLTVCVDEVAASGGYMMASQADRIVAAPFAIVGSIGVIQEGFNFYELCKRYGIQPLVLKSGESKNPISSYGPISRQDMDLEQVRLKKVHRAFQDLVLSGRPQLSTRIMDGSIFSGDEAYELGLIDDIQTSEEYIFTRVGNGDRVLRLHRAGRHKNNAMRNLSVLDLLPHLQSLIAQLRDPAQAVKAMVRLGTYLTLARELIQTAHKVLR
jgi:ClpP class serine protease